MTNFNNLNEETLFIDRVVILRLILSPLTRRTPNETNGSSLEEMMMNGSRGSIRRRTQTRPSSSLMATAAGNAVIRMIVGCRRLRVPNRGHATPVATDGVRR